MVMAKVLHIHAKYLGVYIWETAATVASSLTVTNYCVFRETANGGWHSAFVED